MSATVSDAAAALKEALADIPGLRIADYIPDNPSPPMAVLAIDQVIYHRAFQGGNVEQSFNLMVIVGRDAERSAQRRIDDYLNYDGPQSVRRAIEADPTLGNVVDTTFVEKGGNVQLITIGDANYLVIEFTVIVHA